MDSIASGTPPSTRACPLAAPLGPGEPFYVTDAITDHALGFLDSARRGRSKPWFLHLAYNSPHFPRRAPGVCVAVVAGSFLSWPVAMKFVQDATGMRISEQLLPGRGALLSTLTMAGTVLLVQHLLDERAGALAMLAISVAVGIAAYGLAMSLVGKADLSSLWRNLLTLRPPAVEKTPALSRQVPRGQDG